MTSKAAYFDGVSGRRHEVDVRLGAMLEIAGAGSLHERWRYDDVRRIESQPGVHRYRASTAPELARLEVSDPALAAEIDRVCHHLRDTDGAGRRVLGKIVLLSLAAVVSLVLLAIFGVPFIADRLALLVPAAAEVKLGDAVDGQVRVLFRGRACDRSDSVAALKKLVGALDRSAPAHVPLVPAIIDNPIPNAFALPGGRVYVMRGLLEKAENQDEIAGVIGHEIGHVVHRHGLRKLFQAGGASFLLGLLFGDVFGGAAIVLASRQALESAYSRDAEREADDHAGRVMTGLGRSGVAMAEFLMRLEKGTGTDLPIFFRSHPLTAERIDRLRRLEKPVTGAPILSDTEWQALRSACAG